MFNCGHCGATSKLYEKPIVVAVELRVHEHPARAYHFRGESRHDNGGSGLQIVKEIRVGTACAQSMPEPTITRPAPPEPKPAKVLPPPPVEQSEPAEP